MVGEDEDELTTTLECNAAAAAASRGAYLVIQPTALCQFGCGYCGQTHRDRVLTEDHQEKVVGRARALLAGGRYAELTVGWFGAEALLALPQMRALTGRLRAVAAEHGCRYAAKLVTNGYLLTSAL